MAESMDSKFAKWATGILTAGALAMVTSTILLRESVIRLDGRVANLEESVKAGTSDRYSGTQAKVEHDLNLELFRAVNSRIETIDKRIAEQQGRLRDLESRAGIKSPNGGS